MADQYIKISELPEKERVQNTDYIILEDLQDTWKVKARASYRSYI